MKVSTKGRYGLIIMTDLAKVYGEGPQSLKGIAERHGLSEHYLEQLVSPLRNAGLVRSVRGAFGGYMLNHHPSQITAGDVIRVLEGPINPVDVDEYDDPGTKDLWIRVRDSITEVLDSTTLQDLVEFSKDADDGYMFYI